MENFLSAHIIINNNNIVYYYYYYTSGLFPSSATGPWAGPLRKSERRLTTATLPALSRQAAVATARDFL